MAKDSALAPWPPQPRWMRPGWFLAGVGAGFALCVAAGLALSSLNVYGTQLRRFSGPANFVAMHLPAETQVSSYLGEVVDPAKTVVVLGGDSRMYGMEEIDDETLTGALQRVLGDEYQVINAALPSGGATGFSLTVAELARRRTSRLLYVTNFVEAPYSGDQRLFSAVVRLREEAWADGALQPPPQFDDHIEGRRLRDWASEERIRAQMNAWLRFSQVWNAFEYDVATTHPWLNDIRRPFKSRAWLAAHVPPRAAAPPAQDGPPLPAGAAYANMLDHLGRMDDPARSAVESRLRYYWDQMPRDIVERTVVVFTPFDPKALAAAGIAPGTLLQGIPAIARILEKNGFATLDATYGPVPAQFYDWLHVNTSGADVLAARLAPVIRRKAAGLSVEPPAPQH